MLPLIVLCANDNLEAPDKYTGVYITDKTHPKKSKSTAQSRPVSPSGYVGHNGTFI